MVHVRRTPKAEPWASLTAALNLALIAACSTSEPSLPPSGRPDAGGPVDAGIAEQMDGGFEPSSLEVQIETGFIEGQRADEGTREFLGIPYARPPVDALRWRPPSPPDSWDDLRPTTTFSNECVQPLDSTSSLTTGDEDCLYLNVWAPDQTSTEPLPVLVFLHGGGNFLGSTAEPLGDATTVASDAPLYDGARLAARGSVVVVTLNYRLGALGFLSTPELDAELGRTSGNFGLLDQIAALQWVQRNIDAFGGDPQRVLLFGQSGGGRDANLLLTSPLTEGLFSAATIHSAPLGASRAEPLRERAQALTEEVGCSATPDLLACLREVDAHRLVGAEAARPLGLASAAFLPIVDGYVVVDQPRTRFAAGLVQNVPIMLGTTSAEYSHRWEEVTAQTYAGWVRAFVGARQAGPAIAHYSLERFGSAHEAFVTLMSDRNVTCPHRSFARTAAAAGYDVWLYRFDQVLPAAARSGFGAYHTSDLVYLFQHLGNPLLEGTDADRETEMWMRRLWTQFAAAGDPSLEEELDWAPVDLATEPSLRIGPSPTQEQFLKREDCDFWDSQY